MKITVKDYVFCATGNFKTYQNKGKVLAAIKAAARTPGAAPLTRELAHDHRDAEQGPT